jgi:phosphoenolpyruvate-protein kinase (PTS system EI component)
VAKRVGSGIVASGGDVEGVVHQAKDVSDVFALLKSPELEQTILLADTPSATAIVPLLPRIRGVICTTGGVTSHLAIVSREFGLPCVMAAEIKDPDLLEGKQVRIGADGTIDAL